MADISDDLLKDVLEAFKEVNARFGIQNTKLKKAIDEIEDAVSRSVKSFESLTKQLDTHDKNLRRGSTNIKDMGRSIRDLQDDLDELADSTETLSDLQQGEYSETQKRINQLRSEFNRDLGTTFLKDGLVNLGKTAIELGIALTQSLLTNLTSSASGFKVASDVYTTTLDHNNKMAQAGATAAGQLGQGLALVNKGSVRTFGLALSVAAEGVKYFSQTMTDAAKFSIDFLTKQAETLVTSYNTAASAGLTFAKGMDEFAASATAANLTYDQFAGVVKNSAGLLAQSGFTVSGGVKELGKVSKALREGGLDEQLLRLGFGFEEQAELVAQTMADIRRAGMTARPEQVAQATADYAKNLRMIANLTGEEAKQKMDAARAATEEYAFRQKVMDIARRTGDTTLFQRIQASMALLDPTQQRAVIQRTVGGTITDLAANLRELHGPTEQYVRAIESGAFTAESAMEGFLASNDRLLQGADDMGMALGTAAVLTGQYSEQAKSYTDGLANSIKINTDTFAKAQADAELAANATGSFTQDVVAIAEATQELKMQIQTETMGALKGFAQVVRDTIENIRTMFAEYGVGAGPKEMGFIDKYGRQILQQGIAALGAIAAVSGTTIAAPATGGTSLLATGVAASGGAITGYTIGSVIADFFNLPKKAEGGITTGPTLAGEAGPEAVIPLKQGSVPVALDIGPLIQVMDEQVSISRDLLDEMRDAVDVQKRILQATY